MYKLLGYDVLLDSHRRPHFIEVNARPACLHNPLDAFHGEQNKTWERLKLLAVFQINEMFKIVASTSPWTASPTWRGRTPLAASSTFQMCQVRRRVFALVFQLIGIFSRSVSDWLQLRALQQGFGRAESRKTEVVQANRFQQGALLEFLKTWHQVM